MKIFDLAISLALAAAAAAAFAPPAAAAAGAPSARSTAAPAAGPDGGKPAAASETQWKDLYEQAVSHYQARELDQAEAAGKQALAAARAGQGQTGPFEASSLNLLAMVSQARGDGEGAARLLGEALAISERSLGAHINTATLALNLGHALDRLGRGEEALAPYARSLEIAEALQDGQALRAQALAALARVHAELGHAGQARAYDAQLRTDEAGLPDGERAAALERRAREREAAGDAPGARQALEQALALRDAQPDEAARVRGLTLLAELLERQGQSGAAEPLRQRAVALLEASDPHSLALAGHLNELALRRLEHADYVQAQALWTRALALVEAQAGPDSLDAARIVANQAQGLERQGDAKAAQPLHQRALDIYAAHGDEPEALLGQARAVNYQAGYIYRQRRFAQAEPLFQRALALMERAVGPDDGQLLPVLENLEALYRSQGRGSEASKYAERAARLREAAQRAPS
ncbi:hypothetical protein PIGHUM_00510 [Pigmentiphaga humi]|uniref:Tetratricopeptide repeat protein n=1 Tax=Pigmentiphaga humi TaxID=2478468 RepID=A0A3P4AWM7_9BURK|nr:tetratricopeptide repeat protein [Pigmentiphaga humi]VCU68459.1 hypothetical protein PIGHUM_00510 [Pigmentiphaga humi]